MGRQQNDNVTFASAVWQGGSSFENSKISVG
jgi:hypothetical protein